MKKWIIVLLVLSLAVLTGCACEHEWKDATCDSPKTCALCGETEGEKLEHLWEDATCTAPKTCSLCEKTEGEALEHNFADATCEAPKTCADCGATEGEALGHDWMDATYDAPKTCAVCEETEGAALARADLGLNNEDMALRMSQYMQLLGYDLAFLGNDEYGWPVYAVIEAESGAETAVEVTFEPTEDGELVYAIAFYTDALTDVNASALLGAVATTTALSLDENFDTELLSETLQGEPEMMEGVAVYYMESCGLGVEMQVSDTLLLFWIYPAE